MAPVALISNSPVGMLRVTSSVSRSDSCARSCASKCRRASSFSCARSFSITPCIEAVMNADGFSTSALGLVQSSVALAAWLRMNFRSMWMRKTIPPIRITSKAMEICTFSVGTGVMCLAAGASKAKFIISLPHHQERLIPVHHRRSKENYQKRAGAQKCSKRQFVIRFFAPGQNQYDPDDAAEYRPRHDRQQRPLRAQERPGHQHHFHVAQAHAFAPAQFEIRFRNQPEQTAAYGGTQQRVYQGKHRIRRRELEDVTGEP